MASTVTLKYGELTETILLCEGRLHLPTIKDVFTLCVPKIDGVLAPVDIQGFTHAIFKPGDSPVSQHQWHFSGSCCYVRYTTLKGAAAMGQT